MIILVDQFGTRYVYTVAPSEPEARSLLASVLQRHRALVHPLALLRAEPATADEIRFAKEVKP